MFESYDEKLLFEILANHSTNEVVLRITHVDGSNFFIGDVPFNELYFRWDIEKAKDIARYIKDAVSMLEVSQ